ncbi:hypothetical protein ILUMI_08358 [Ignelater luminosus]|uniref:Peptidase S1 domain-containing protein n=1 Tax=Ignelater luminosus TaxID=2038154 RepID=A0A8K0D4J6_IGNLU|nr:hypothetical protein ILUMI_08358 [Ignelater luminosus]
MFRMSRVNAFIPDGGGESGEKLGRGSTTGCYQKQQVFVDKPRTIPEFKRIIIEEVANIPSDMLHNVMENFHERLQECIERRKAADTPGWEQEMDLEAAWENFKEVIRATAEEVCGRVPIGGKKMKATWWWWRTEELKLEVAAKKEITSVRLGEYNTNSTLDCVSYSDYEECSESVIKVAVEETILHPDYKLDIKGISFNIALIRLGNRISYSDYVRPICLPDLEFRAQVGDNLTTTGRGTTVWGNYLH